MKALGHIALSAALLIAPCIAHAAIAPENAPQSGSRTAAEQKSRPAEKIQVRVTHVVGTIVELTVSCGGKTQIVNFSPVYKRYCNAQRRCAASLLPVISKTCLA